MRILVTGGAGYIGSHFVNKVSEKEDIDIVVVDNFSQTRNNIIKGNKIEYCEVDLCDKLALNNVFKQNKIDVVVHFAALASVPDSVTKPRDYFINNIYPRIKDYNTLLIVNVNGSTVEEYIEVTEKINELESVPAIELNISCPNVKEGGMAFGISCPGAEAVTRAVRAAYDKTLIVKLSPNVTDIAEIAKAVEGQGADSVSLVNTFLGMAIDAEKRIPLLSTITGGLSGPAIKPIALRMVWQVFQAVKIPVIGIGGIMNATDAIEFFLAGSSAVQIGTAIFKDPFIPLDIIKGIEDYLKRHSLNSIKDIIGNLQM